MANRASKYREALNDACQKASALDTQWNLRFRTALKENRLILDTDPKLDANGTLLPGAESNDYPDGNRPYTAPRSANWSEDSDPDGWPEKTVVIWIP